MIYAQKNAAGQPELIAPGADFKTYWVRIADEQEAAWALTLVGETWTQTPVGELYLLPEPDTGNPTAFTAWGPEDWDRRGVALFPDPEVPPGKMLADLGLDLDEDGAITIAPTFADRPLEELRAAKRAEAIAVYQEQRQSEFAWDFGEIPTKDDFGVDQGPAGVQTLQMREGPGTDDQKNWTVAMTTALALEAGGQGEQTLPIKVTSNLWALTSASQVLDILLRGSEEQMSAVQRGMAQLQRIGVLKAQIDAAADAEALAAIDIAAGWPGNVSP